MKKKEEEEEEYMIRDNNYKVIGHNKNIYI